MKYLYRNLPVILKRLWQASGLILFLDFDGTLAPLAPVSEQAKISKTAKQTLKKCAQLFRIVIISGRTLPDIRKRVGLPELIYAGNHGLEWQVGKKYSRIPVSWATQRSLRAAVARLRSLERDYQGVLFEDKRLSLALHYRQLSSSRVRVFKKKVGPILQSLTNNRHLSITHGKKVIEIRPNINWHKGHLAQAMAHKSLAIYLGDDRTDEDAFRALKTGITIRVGKNKKSQAAYYVNCVKQVEIFLQWLYIAFSKFVDKI